MRKRKKNFRKFFFSGNPKNFRKTTTQKIPKEAPTTVGEGVSDTHAWYLASEVEIRSLGRIIPLWPKNPKNPKNPISPISPLWPLQPLPSQLPLRPIRPLCYIPGSMRVKMSFLETSKTHVIPDFSRSIMEKSMILTCPCAVWDEDSKSRSISSLRPTVAELVWTKLNGNN
jgi:hypothetical protein